MSEPKTTTWRCDSFLMTPILTEIDAATGRPVNEQQLAQVRVFRARVPDPWSKIDADLDAIKKLEETSKA